VTQEQWVLEVYNRFPYKTGKTDGELQAIRDDLIQFASKQTPNILSPIFAEFSAMKPPKGFGMWWFYSKVEKKNDRQIWWRICEYGHKYEDTGSTCPVCNSPSFKLATGEVQPTEMIQVQESCSNCNWYKDDQIERVRGLYGPSCQEYGTEKHWQVKECKDCKCRDCCHVAYLYQNNKDAYLDMVGGLLEKKFKETGLIWAPAGGKIEDFKEGRSGQNN